MTISAQGFAPALRRTGAALALALFLAPAAMADDTALVLHSDTGDYAFKVEVVDTPEGRARGLMYVTELAEDAGMLFDFKQESPVSFWMRNTFIPLDMIFVGADGVIKNIHVNARPHDPTGIPSDGPVRFVLEIPGGRSVEIGLKAGDTMEHARVGTPVAN